MKWPEMVRAKQMEGAMAQKPVKKIKLGNIQASIWKNSGDNGKVWFNVVVTKSYRDGDEYKDTNSFSHCDLPVVSKAMDFAYGWIWKRQLVDEKKSNGDA
jgi:hypothetical protein